MHSTPPFSRPSPTHDRLKQQLSQVLDLEEEQLRGVPIPQISRMLPCSAPIPEIIYSDMAVLSTEPTRLSTL